MKGLYFLISTVYFVNSPFSRRTSYFSCGGCAKADYKKKDFTEGITDWDLCSVVCGFQKAAVERLRRLCEQSNAKIVLETSWKCMRSLMKMKRLFPCGDWTAILLT